jgi:hypothetical protein
LEEAIPEILSDLAKVSGMEESLSDIHRTLAQMIDFSDEYSRSEREKMEAIKENWNQTLIFAPNSQHDH